MEFPWGSAPAKRLKTTGLPYGQYKSGPHRKEVIKVSTSWEKFCPPLNTLKMLRKQLEYLDIPKIVLQINLGLLSNGGKSDHSKECFVGRIIRKCEGLGSHTIYCYFQTPYHRSFEARRFLYFFHKLKMVVEINLMCYIM